MKRKSIDKLILWKEAEKRRPALITGAKGVGKTYLTYDFAKAFFEHIYYVNFQQDFRMREFFTSALKDGPEQLKQYFHITSETNSETGILILDEIGYCEEAFQLIEQSDFTGQFPYILCISSTQISNSFTKKLSELTIAPLDFDEFLIATGNEWYIEPIQTHYAGNTKLPDIVHKELLDLYQLYLRVGGMPGSINEYLSLNSAINVSEQHKVQWGAIQNHIMNGYQEGDSFKMLQVLNSTGDQLMKENKKFQYKLIRKGTTHSMYKDAIQKLIDNYYVIKCNRMESNPTYEPDDAKGDIAAWDTLNTNFKLYLPDTGILYTKIAQEYDISLNNNFKRTLLENNIAQLLKGKQYPFAFWESDSMAKIDFVMHKAGMTIPIEVFPDVNTRSKSLSVFRRSFEYPYAIKVSARNFEYTGNIKYVPYYALFCI